MNGLLDKPIGGKINKSIFSSEDCRSRCIFEMYPAEKKKFCKKNTKSIMSGKTKNRTKMLFMHKMSVRSIPIYPENLIIFKESLLFGHPKHPFWMPVTPKRDMMKYEILCHSFF